MHIKLICLYILFAVISVCTNSMSSSKHVYLDSSLVPEYTNLTCFCYVTAQRRVDIVAMSLLYPDQLAIIIDEEEYETPFVNTTNDVFGRRPFQLRYTTYEHAINKICLLLDGNRF